MKIFIIFFIIYIILFLIISWEIQLLDFINHNTNKIYYCSLVININCKLHLGDNVYNMYYLNSLKEFIESNKIIINYYIPKEYINQISEFKTSNNINILPYENKGLYLGLTNFTFTNNSITIFFNDRVFKNKKIVYDKLYINFYNEASQKLGLQFKINNFLNTDPSLLIDYDNLNVKYKDLDILVINSDSKSLQYLNILFDDWDNFIYKLHNHGFKICTTKKVKNITCSLDDNLSLKKIGAMSTRAKIIIGINTGPLSTVFNIYTMNYVKKIYIFDNRVTFSYDKMVDTNYLDEINIEDLKKLLN